MRGERCFATKEGALEFHAGLMATIQKAGGAEELLELINKAGDEDGEGQDGANLVERTAMKQKISDSRQTTTSEVLDLGRFTACWADDTSEELRWRGG